MNIRKGLLILTACLLLAATLNGCILPLNYILSDPRSDAFSEMNDSYASEALTEFEVIDRTYDFFNASLFPENTDEEYTHISKEPEIDYDRIFYAGGHCETLEGKKIVALFFLDDDESRWDADAIDRYTRTMVLPSLKFIKDEAAVWNIELDFEVWRFSTPLSPGLSMTYTGLVNPDLDNGGSTKDAMEQATGAFGYVHDMNLIRGLTQQSDGRDIIPLVAINKNGVSYSRKMYYGRSTDSCEHSVTFSHKLTGDDYDSSSIAFHILSLYGAESLFASDERLNLAEQFYPGDIMLSSGFSIDMLEINAFTAYAIGWTPYRPAVCDEENWYRNEPNYAGHRPSPTTIEAGDA